MRNRIRFEVLTAVTVKNTLFWDVILCSPLEVQQCVRATYCLSFLCFLLGLLFDPEGGANTFLRNVGELLLDYTALHPTRQYSSNGKSLCEFKTLNVW
jgi:hypothetical protein